MILNPNISLFRIQPTNHGQPADIPAIYNGLYRQIYAHSALRTLSSGKGSK